MISLELERAEFDARQEKPEPARGAGRAAAFLQDAEVQGTSGPLGRVGWSSCALHRCGGPAIELSPSLEVETYDVRRHRVERHQRETPPEAEERR